MWQRNSTQLYGLDKFENQLAGIIRLHLLVRKDTYVNEHDKLIQLYT